VENEVFIVNEDYQPYKPVIQRIRKGDDSTIYRLCYFVIAGKGNIGFGQFSLIVKGGRSLYTIKPAAERHWPGFEAIDSR
jgi:hypothetical protein